ncbi:hypothetical protein [Bradyrhizobium sp. McL0616]|uniref:hypothetical protein n=1 Tax=Bradyrhizobium sp. McL0616 TaxID=3415674 RepID=UPI003CF51DF5
MKKLALAFTVLALPAIAWAEEADEKLAPTISCDQFRERLRDALLGNREGIALVDLFTGPKKEKFEVSGIQAAITCSRVGMFEGFGASLLETDDGSARRYARFSAAAVRATEPSFDHAAALTFVVSLAKTALQEARRNERRSGWLTGNAEENLGSYVVDYTMHNALVSTQIDLRYKQEHLE